MEKQHYTSVIQEENLTKKSWIYLKKFLYTVQSQSKLFRLQLFKYYGIYTVTGIVRKKNVSSYKQVTIGITNQFSPRKRKLSLLLFFIRQGFRFEKSKREPIESFKGIYYIIRDVKVTATID